MEMRDLTQADFDLERMFGLLDEALTSRDERVQSALRGLLTIIELTRTQDDGLMAVETSHGPLRQLQQDLRDLSRRVYQLEDEMRQRSRAPGPFVPPAPYNPGPGSPFGPYTNPGGIGPIWTTSKSSSSYTLTDDETDSILKNNPIKLTK